MAKNLLETYRQILSELTPPPSMVKAAQSAQAQRQTNTQARMGGNPTGQASSQSMPKPPIPKARPTEQRVSNYVPGVGSSAPAAANRAAAVQAAAPKVPSGKVASPMVNSGAASSWTGPAGSMNPLDKRTDMQRATQGASAMSANRAKSADNPRGPVVTPKDAAETARRNAARYVPQNTNMRASPLDQTGGAGAAASTYRKAQADANAKDVATRDLDQDRPASAKYNSRQQMRPDVQMPEKPTAGPAPTKIGDTGIKKTTNPLQKKKAEAQSFGQAFAAARKKAGGAGGKFTYKGKVYQTNVKGEKYKKASKLKSVDEQTLEENRVVKKTHKSMLAHPQARLGKGQQSVSNGRRYRVRVKALSETEMNSGKKKVVVNFEPENRNPIQ